MNMDIETKISTARKLIDEYKTKISEYDQLALSSLLYRLERIQELTNQDKYRLVFIGGVGAGKTTAICHWLGLLEDKLEGKTPGSVTLFKTSTSRTTATEVHLTNNPCTSNITIIPRKLKEQIKIVENYCQMIWDLHFDNMEDDDNGIKPPSSVEIDSIIHNMVGCRDVEEFEDIIDRRNFTECDEFTNYILSIIDLPNRIKKNAVSFDGSLNFKKWLKRQFKCANDGLEGFSIPRSININIHPKDIDLHFPKCIYEIIDTKGVDTDKNAFSRDDLISYIRADDTINIIVDSLRELPSPLSLHAFKSWIIKEDRDIKPRASILVKCTNNELINIDGAENIDDGARIKRSQFRSLARQNSMNLEKDNTIFYDAHRGLICETKNERTVIASVDDEKTKLNNNKFTNHITNIADSYQRRLLAESDVVFSQIEEIFSNLKDKHSEQYYADQKQIVSKISQIQTQALKELQTIPEINSFALKYTIYLRQHIHWVSMSKTTDIYGQWYNANIYSLAVDYIISKLSSTTSSMKSQIDLLWNSAKDPEFQKLSKGYQELSLTSYRNMLLSIEQKVRLVVMQRFFLECQNVEDNDKPNNEFWNKAQKTKRGTGYFTRLIENYKEWLQSPTIDKFIISAVNDEVIKYFDALNKSFE